MKAFLYVSLVCMLASCGSKSLTIEVRNKSDKAIDSVVIVTPETNILFAPVNSDAVLSKTVSISDSELGEGDFVARIYQKSTAVNAKQFGYHQSYKALKSNYSIVIDTAYQIKEIQ